MSITKSYNKHTDTYYAYDTTYVWDETKQRKVQKKVCIGHYDPETGKIIQNAKRGRPSRPNVVPAEKQKPVQDSCNISENLKQEFCATVAEIKEIESAISALEERFRLLKERMLSLYPSVAENEQS